MSARLLSSLETAHPSPNDDRFASSNAQNELKLEQHVDDALMICVRQWHRVHARHARLTRLEK